MQAAFESLVGDAKSRWFDKTLTLLSFKNGLIGQNCDVSVFVMKQDPNNNKSGFLNQFSRFIFLILKFSEALSGQFQQSVDFRISDS